MCTPRVLLSLVLVGCGTSNGAPVPTEDTGSAATDTGTVEDTGTAPETPEVCGTKVGDKLCDLDIQGYVRDGLDTGLATSTEYKIVKMSEVLAAGTAPYAYVYTGAFW